MLNNNLFMGKQKLLSFSLVCLLMITMILFSGCINLNITQKINRGGSSDINLTIKSENSMFLNYFKQNMENSSLAIEKAIFSEGDNYISYYWKDVYPIAPKESNISIGKISIYKEFKFPYYYITINFDNSENLLEEYNETNNLTKEIFNSMKLNYDFEVYGKITDTNGIKLRDNKVRFDLLKNKKYYVKFRDLFLTNWFGSVFSKKPCKPEWSCSDWKWIDTDKKGRKCIVSNECKNYFAKPLERKEVTPPDCGDKDICTRDYFDYINETCVNEPIIPCCGNGKCESGETYTICPSDCKRPEPKDLVLQLSDLPEGYEIYSRGERTKSDVSKEALEYGWERGYFVQFNKKGSHEIVLENHVSLYSKENITEMFSTLVEKRESVKFDSKTQTVLKLEKLSNPNVGDRSVAYKITYEDTFGNILDTRYSIEFIKEDVYEYLLGRDYELLKECAKKLEKKI